MKSNLQFPAANSQRRTDTTGEALSRPSSQEKRTVPTQDPLECLTSSTRPVKRLRAASLAEEMISATRFGKKYEGLLRLQALGESLGFKVPPFLGVTKVQAQDAVLTQTLPIDLQEFIEQHKDKFPRLMVRSSSSQEDCAGQANAGCFATVANVPCDKASLLNAMQKVVDSFTSVSAKAQTNLYRTGAAATGEPLPSSVEEQGGLVIQVMIGEVGENGLIPVSGVGLSPDPRSNQPGSFLLNHAMGHGEGVVTSQVAVDAITGIAADQGEVSFRTSVAKQPQRMRPGADGELVMVDQRNLAESKAPKLSEEMTGRIAHALQGITQEHSSGVDIEYVVLGDELYVVQQRAQDESKAQATPSYLSEAFLQSHAQKTYPIEVASYRNHGCYVTESVEGIIAAKLDNAFYQEYLGRASQMVAGDSTPAVKTVFVQPPANSNAHATLMFRQQNIAIIAVSDDKLFEALKQSKTTVIDEQRDLVVLDAQLEDVDRRAGWLKYPAPSVYSIPKAPTPLTTSEKDDVKRLVSLAPGFNPYEGQTLLQLHGALSNLVMTERQDRVQAIELASAVLLRQALSYLKISQQKNIPLLGRVAHELVTDTLRFVKSTKTNTSPLSQLQNLNWIDAVIRQRPSDHPRLANVFSVSSVLKQLKLLQQFKQWWTQQGVTVSTAELKKIKTLFLVAADLPAQAQTRWRHELAAVAQQDTDRSATLDAVVRPMCYGKKLDALEAVYADRVIHAETENALMHVYSPSLKTAFKGMLIALESVGALDEVVAAQKTQWSNAARFTDNLEALETAVESLNDIVDALRPTDFPNLSLVLLTRVQGFFEQMDQFLKTIAATPDYATTPNNVTTPDNAIAKASGREQNFGKALTVFMAALEPLLVRAFDAKQEQMLHFGAGDNLYDSDYEDDDQYVQLMQRPAASEKTNSYLSWLSSQLADAKTPEAQKLYPTEAFSVQNYLYGEFVKVGAAKSTVVLSYGDVHTLLHQNSRMAIAELTGKATQALQLPGPIRGLKQCIDTGLTEGCQSDHHDRTQIVKLMSLKTEQGTHYLEYALPLREHGLRVCFTIPPEADRVSVAVAMDGDNENNRWDVIASTLQHARVPGKALQSFQRGATVWPDEKTATAADYIGWTETVSADDPDGDGMRERLAYHIDTIIYLSFAFWNEGFNVDDPFHDFFIPNTDEGEGLSIERRTFYLYEIADAFTACVAQQDHKGLLELLVNKLSFSLPGDDGNDKFNFNNETPWMNESDFRTGLADIIDAQGVMERRCGPFELGEAIVTHYDQHA